MSFSFGNTHERVPNPKPCRSNPDYMNRHKWCMFMKVDEDNELTSKIIKSVTYKLFPGFKPRVVQLLKPPFLLSRVGWGYFDVEIEVEFHRKFNLSKRTIWHELSFDGQGRTQNF